MLDPSLYSLDDRASFQKRIQLRQEIADICYRLGDEDPYGVNEVLEELGELSLEDDFIKEKLFYLKNHLDPDNSEMSSGVAFAVEEVRIHLLESYRIHRRLLRTRRGKSTENYLSKQRNGLKKLFTYSDKQTISLDQALHRWRLSFPEGEEQSFQHLYTTFLQLMWSDTLLLEEAVKLRMSEKSDRIKNGWLHFVGIDLSVFSSVPEAQKEELAALEELLGALKKNQQEHRRLNVLIKCIREEHSIIRWVIFCNDSSTADRLYECLKKDFVGSEVWRHRLYDSKWKSFSCSKERAILVCDKTAEEGLNLQGPASAVVHFDLLLSPNRLEQRIGRCDRFGTKSPVHSFVIVDEEGETLQNLWCDILENGFQIFNESISGLQYVVEELMQKVLRSLPCEGHDGLRDIQGILEEGYLKREWKKIRNQEVMDVDITLDNHLLEEQFEEIDELDDEKGERLYQSIRVYLNDLLLFKQENYSNNVMSDKKDFVSEGVRFRYLVSKLQKTKSTLLPVEKVLKFFHKLLDIDYHLPWLFHNRRKFQYLQKTEKYPSMQLARLGAPLVNAINLFMQWDDRGHSSAMWRYREDLPEYCAERFFLRFDLLLEAETSSVSKRVSSWQEKWKNYPISSDTFQRRADEFFSPSYITFWVDQDLNIIKESEEELIELLEEDYQKSVLSQGRDFNLNAQRMSVIRTLDDESFLFLKELRERRDWANFVTTSAKVVQEEIFLTSEIFFQKKQQALKKLGDERRRQETIMKSRRQAIQFLPKNQQEQELQWVSLEQEILLGLVDDCENPQVKVDAIGLVILSKRNPFKSLGQEDV